MSKNVKTLLITHTIQPTISICFLIQCTYWKTFVKIYLTHWALFFHLLNLITVLILLMFEVYAIFSDYHSTNVLAFKYLFNMYGNEQKGENIINYPSNTANNIYLSLIQCTYWKTFVRTYLTHWDLIFPLLNLISFLILLMHLGEK